MPIINTWSVNQLDTYPEHAGESDIVFNVHWTLAGSDGTYTGSVYGSESVSMDLADGVTPYADLTEAQVIAWVHGAMGSEQVAAHEANVVQQIADQIDPPVATPPLPWSA